jgi:hypothetical protein
MLAGEETEEPQVVGETEQLPIGAGSIFTPRPITKWFETVFR